MKKIILGLILFNSVSAFAKAEMTVNAGETGFEKTKAIYKSLFRDSRNYVHDEAKLVKSGDYRGLCFSKKSPDAAIGMILTIRKFQKNNRPVWKADFISNNSASTQDYSISRDWLDALWKTDGVGSRLSKSSSGGVIIAQGNPFETRLMKDFSSGYWYAYQPQGFDLSEVICYFGK